HPHDHFFRQSFGLPEVALDYLRNFLPAELAKKLHFEAIERVEGSFVSRKLRTHISDIIYRCPLKTKGSVYITFLFEHKSTPQTYPHLQLMRYMLEVWERAVEEKKTLPLIVPIIVYHGKTRWELKPFSDSFEDWDESLRPYLPAFDYLLTDLSRLNDDEIIQLKAHFLINVLLSLKHQGEKTYLLSNISFLFYGLEHTKDKHPEKNFTERILVYLLVTTEFSDQDWAKLIDQTPSPIKDIAMSTYDMLIKKGKEQGIELGKEQGIELGKEQGIELGKEQGIKLKAHEVVLALLLEFPEFSDARIAALAKVEDRFVKALRDEVALLK
ncbi:MAG: Rpn family recombination-promoting nuclease/putative transposase, partial [Saprospiraceae bacterium]|nr:Rpn family recombination-promoting nuclease/putative transposase [Saprospiraceae bacterium]